MKTNVWLFLIMAILGAFIGCAMLVVVMLNSGIAIGSHVSSSQVITSSTPGMDVLEDFTCPKGQTKILTIYGVEDGFSREGEELAIIRPELLELPLYEDVYTERSNLYGFRNFDERGTDGHLITYVDFPPKIVSGIFVSRMEPLPGSSTDMIVFGDFVDKSKAGLVINHFGVSIPEIQEDVEGSIKHGVVKLTLSDFSSQYRGGQSDLLKYLQSNTNGVTLDVRIQDDTVVDFFGLAFCQKPLRRKGTTLVSDSRGLFSSNVVHLSCNTDPNQHMCDPYAGDLVCNSPAPLGCYKEGNQPPPKGISSQIERYVGGYIRMTSPVAGGRFHSLAEANKFCAASFGSDWRVLSYHEGGGGIIVGNGYIPPKSRVWVDVKDKPAANCWTNGYDQGGKGE